MKKSQFNLKNLLFCAMTCAAFALLSQPISAQQTSNSDSELVTVKKAVINDCGKALDELSIFDKLVESKEAEIKLLREKLELQKEKFELVRELADARAKQADSLTEAVSALKEAIAAKDKQLENKDKEIEILKKKKTSILTIIKAIAAGVGVGLILK